MDREAVEVHKLAKKERGRYPTILSEQAWSVKDLLYGFRGNFSCGKRWVVPSRHSYKNDAHMEKHVAHV